MVPIIVRDRVFSYSHTIGAQAAGGPGFRFPVDLALGKSNTIYVVNRGHDGEESHRVSIITTDSGYIGQFGSFGEGDGQFIWPGGVAVDGQGIVSNYRQNAHQGAAPLICNFPVWYRIPS